MPHSPTSSQTETFRRYFTESCKNFTGNAIITDTYTDGFRLSAFHRELKNIYCICHNHQRNIFVGIFPARILFLARIFHL